MSLDIRSFTEKLRVTDGAWGTQLQALGLPPGNPPEIWNASSPASVEKVAAGYVQAGSDVIITNTFGANKFVLDSHGAADRVAALAEAGARISLKAVEGTDVKVFGSIGPTGKIVMMGDVSPDELGAAFTEAAEALQWGGVDAIVLETFNELDEARIALEAVKSACQLPVILSMTFASGADGTSTMMGNSPADLAKLAGKYGADGIGANCGTGPENYVKVARMFREVTDLPLWIKANAGLPELVKGKTTFPMGPEEFASFVPQLAEAGANFIGGCCGTTPDHIRRVREAVDGL